MGVPHWQETYPNGSEVSLTELGANGFKWNKAHWKSGDGLNIKPGKLIY